MLSFTLFIPSRAIGLAFALGLLVFTVGAFTADAGRAEAPLGAPYQVLGAAMFRDDRYRMETGLGLQSPRILVDLGNALSVPPGSPGGRSRTSARNATTSAAMRGRSATTWASSF
jgi:hypothetical protein